MTNYFDFSDVTTLSVPLKYEAGLLWKIYADLSDHEDLGEYHRTLAEIDGTKLNRPKFPLHVSVYRSNVPPPDWTYWSHIKMATISYSSLVRNDQIYWWLPVQSHSLEQLRLQFGLDPIDDVTMSPDKQDRFHITIGNCKALSS